MENEDPLSVDEIPLPAAKRPKPQPQNPTFNLSAAISQAVMKGRPKNAGPPSSLLRGIGAYASEADQEGEAALEETQAEGDDEEEEEDTLRPLSFRKQKPATTFTAPPRRKCQPCAASKKSCPGGHPCDRCVKRSAPEACIEYIPKQSRKQVASDSSPRPVKRIKPIATANSAPQSAYQTSGNGDTIAGPVEPRASSTFAKATKVSTAGSKPTNGPRCKACIARKKGCDRKRPCRRCVDKGLGWEECVPEDEDD